MGHLFEKTKICHGCQGNYHSERKGGQVAWGKKKKEVQQLLWTELDFGGILSLQDNQQRGLFFLFSLYLSTPLHVTLSHSFHFPHLPLSACPSVFLAVALIFPSPLHISLPPISLISLFFYPSCCSIIKYQCEICLQLEAWTPLSNPQCPPMTAFLLSEKSHPLCWSPPHTPW